MSSIGTGYDLAASTFSPDGRIFQVEYAQKAVDTGGTAVALRGRDTVVLVAEKTLPSPLMLEGSCRRVTALERHIGFCSAGLYCDAKALLDEARDQAQEYRKEYFHHAPVERIADELAQYVHYFTLGIHRPFGCSIFLSGYDKKTGPHLYVVDCSGDFFEYKAWAIGKHRQAAKAEIEKLHLGDMTAKQLIDEAVRILLVTREEGSDTNLRIEVGQIGEHTGGIHVNLTAEEVKAVETAAQAKISEEEDMED